MAYKKLNLDVIDNSRMGLMVYGANNSGKTHLAGDMLRWGIEKGWKVRYLNLAGEDGYKTLGAMGLGEIGEDLETYTDFDEALIRAKADGIQVMAVDSLPAYSNMQFRRFLGGELRYPDPTRDGERAKMLWGQIKLGVMDGVLRSRAAVPYVLWLATHDKGTSDSVQDVASQTPASIMPDLVGQQSRGSIGWFDLVAHIRTQMVGPGRAKRTLELSPDEKVLTRLRAPRPILEDVVIPEGRGGWQALMTAYEKATAKVEKAVAAKESK